MNRYTISDCACEELSHTAEVGLSVRATTPEALFACAAVGMFGLTGARPEVSGRNHRTVALESADLDSLMVDWLSELIFLTETTGEVYDTCQVTRWEPERLVGVVEGAAPAAPPNVTIKAVTYHGLRITHEDGSWLAEIYFDI